MVHNNGRPVTFLHVRIRNTETCCVSVGLSIIGAHLPLGLGKNGKRKNKYLQIVFREPALDWDASCSKAKCKEKMVVCSRKKEFSFQCTYIKRRG